MTKAAMKNLLASHIELIQDLWLPLSDDPMLSGISKVIAMLIVAGDICLCGLAGFLAVFCICNLVTILLYVVAPVSVLFAITYGIAHIKLPKDKDGNDI